MWLIKFLGAILITVSSLGVSMNAVNKVKRRVDALEWYSKAAGIIGVQINGTAAELYDIVATICGSRDYLELSRPFVVKFKQTELKPNEKRTVEEFFENLGMGEIEAQVKRCEGYAAVFAERLKEARAEYTEKAKLYRMLGLFSGIAISIILV